MDASNLHLSPLASHVELRDYLKSSEGALWDWFASARAKADYTETLRLDLLKSTYRLDADGHPELYRSVEEAKAGLQMDIPVTCYQAQNSHHLNAALYFIPGEGHIVFSGPVLALLKADELKSVIGHELAHYHLWREDDGAFHITDRLIHAAASDPRAAISHEQTARRYQLYTEVFADRGSLCVTGDINPVISGLVKVQTGLSEVSAASYLKQAGEIFSKGKVATEEVSHPELFIRAQAVALWREQGEDSATRICEMIEGSGTLDGLDLVGQKRLSHETRRLLEHFLEPKWFQTPTVLGHARLYFDDFKPASTRNPVSLDRLAFAAATFREYASFVLLDFVTVDPELDEMPLAAALELAREMELGPQFEKLVARELKMKACEVARIQEQAAQMLAKAEVERV